MSAKKAFLIEHGTYAFILLLIIAVFWFDGSVKMVIAAAILFVASLIIFAVAQAKGIFPRQNVRLGVWPWLVIVIWNVLPRVPAYSPYYKAYQALPFAVWIVDIVATYLCNFTFVKPDTTENPIQNTSEDDDLPPLK